MQPDISARTGLSDSSLKVRILKAARAMLEEDGAESLQLRAIAERVATGAASLYYYFANKDELLAALAVEGFADLRQQLEAAARSAPRGHGMQAASRTYLTFIREHIHLHGLMFAGGALASHVAVREAEALALNSFESAVAADGRYPPERVHDIALTGWILGRGIASQLLSRNVLDREEAMAFVDSVLGGFRYLIAR